jgi:hypothetical protein
VVASVPVVFSAAAEGEVDEAVLRRVVEQTGGKVGRVYGKCGWDRLRERIWHYNLAARNTSWPWIVLADLDRRFSCAPALVKKWLPVRSRSMALRVAVQAIEAWLLADRKGFAEFFRVPASRIPLQPEALPDPKQAVVELVRRSRWHQIREEMVPRPGSGRKVGPAYTSRLIEFIRTKWRPEAASNACPSLRGFCTAVERLIAYHGGQR